MRGVRLRESGSQAFSTSSAPQSPEHPRNIRNEGLGHSGELQVKQICLSVSRIERCKYVTNVSDFLFRSHRCSQCLIFG